MSTAKEPVVVVVHGPIELGTVDALAQLQLAVRRLGGYVVVRDAPRELADLLGLTGLRDVLCAGGDLCGRGRQPEEREKPLGVEEEADP